MTDKTQGNILDELQWRGLIAQSTDEDALRTQLDEPSVVYVGFDPTGPSLHAGHLVPLLMLRRFQLAGHTPIILSGGATGLIGDPRDVGERVMNDESTVAQWSEKINVQLSKFVNLSGENAAIQANNLDWISNLDVITFLRDIGKNFSLNTMLSRDTVKRRLESDGISYTEFSYMLLQANDFVELRRRYDCRIEIGGSDQWGNIVSGVDLNRRMDAEQVHGLTVPLVTDSEGNKFGKSTGGGKLWLDPDMTSPYTWYQYFFNTADADVMKYLRWFTFLDQETLDALQVEVEERPFKREAQRTLAREMTTLVHGLDAVGDVEKAAQALFGKAELSDLDEATLKGALSETTIIDVPTGTSIIDLLVDAGFADSKGAARRVIKEGGAYVNNERIADEDWVAKPEDFLHGQWLVLRKGKKNYAGGKLV